MKQTKKDIFNAAALIASGMVTQNFGNIDARFRVKIAKDCVALAMEIDNQVEIAKPENHSDAVAVAPVVRKVRLKSSETSQ